MNRLDLTQTNMAVKRLIETTTDPRRTCICSRRWNRRRYLEMAGRFEEIFAAEMKPSRNPCITSISARDDHHS